MHNDQTPAKRLEYLRGELRAERISYGELAELQSLADKIDPGDVELLQAAGIPEEQDERLLALAAFLDEDPDDWSESTYQETLYECGNQSYLVLTDEEADAAAAEDIEQSLWAFNASFLAGYLPAGVGEEVIEALQPQCEGANDAIRSMVGDRFEDLVSDAISADGRGHFLAGYDHNEGEEKIGDTYYYLYRTN